MTLFQKIESRLLKKSVLSVGYSDIHGVNGLLVKIVQNNLQIVQTIAGAEKLTDFLKEHPEVPVTLGIDTAAVLFSNTEELVTAESYQAAFQDFVPGGVESQFLIQFRNSCLTIIRNSSIDAIEKELTLEGRIVNVSLLPVSGFYLADFLRKEEPDVHLDRFAYSVHEESESVSVTHVNEAIVEIEGEKISPAQIVPLVSVVDYINASASKTGDAKWDRQYRDFLFRRLFQLSRMPIMGFFLVVLLVNSYLFITGDEKLQAIREQTVYSNQVNEQIRKADEYLAAHKDIRKELSGQPYFSIICDQIGTLTPRNVNLTTLSLHPQVKSRLSKNTFEEDIVSIAGETQEPMHYINWLEQLKSQNWVKAIESQKYETDPSGLGHFEITLRLRKEWYDF